MKKTCALVVLLTALLLCFSAQAALNLPDDLTNIEDYAFYEDTSLTGVIDIPDGVTHIGYRAFSYTDVYALRIPASCTSIEDYILSGTEAAYIYLDTYRSLSSNVTSAVSYVFVENGMSTDVSGKYINMDYVHEYDGMYYLEQGDFVTPLCPVDRTQLGGSVSIPKIFNGYGVTDLDMLVMPGCEDISFFYPSYLTPPSFLTNAIGVQYMTLGYPEFSGDMTVGGEVTINVAIGGEVGQVYYDYEIETPSGNVLTLYDSLANEVYYSNPSVAGTYWLYVTATDSLGDFDSWYVPFEITGSAANAVTYRALLIGNTYPDTANELPGPDNDIAAMRNMLNMYDGSDYQVTSYQNLSATGIKTAISSALGDADSNDVSLFYYSGHGASDGSLCGIGSGYYGITYVTVNDLRNALDQIPGTKIVLLDSCYSGAHINKSTGKPETESSPASFTSAVINAFGSAPKARNAVISTEPALSEKPRANLATAGYVVMTACSQYQTSSSLGNSNGFWFGAFTYGVCLGSGYVMTTGSTNGTVWADANDDGAITLGECYTDTVDTVMNVLDCDQSTKYYGDTSFILWFD